MRRCLKGPWTSRGVLVAAVALAALVSAPLSARTADPVVAYTIVNGNSIPASLSGAPGDAARGRRLYASNPRAGCPACHGMPGDPGGGVTAPDLAGIGARLTPGQIRLWLVAPEAQDAATKMPSFYAAGQRKAADDPLYGGPALTAAEIEDLVAYLAGLRSGK